MTFSFSMAYEQFGTSLNLPRRRGKSSATTEMERAISAIVDERAPITIRGICYGLFVMGLIKSMATGETAKVSRIATAMRESGALDWTKVVDASRSVDRAQSWRNPDAIIDVAVNAYRRNAWQDQPAHVEIWCEKSTVAGVLAPVLDAYGVTFRALKGFGSYTSIRQAAEDSLDLDPSQSGHVLYLGDWDPSGLFMSMVDLPKRLERYGSRWHYQRIAIIDGDLDALPSFPTASKSDDGRYAWYVQHTTADPTKCWELDAMDPNDLRERVGGAIDTFIDQDAWRHSKRIEQAEVESMQSFQRSWASISEISSRK